jgi:hypothetical protein
LNEERACPHNRPISSSTREKKGALAIGQLADLAVLSADYFAIPEKEIKPIESVLTVVGGKVVFAGDGFEPHAPPLLPITPRLVARWFLRRLPSRRESGRDGPSSRIWPRFGDASRRSIGGENRANPLLGSVLRLLGFLKNGTRGRSEP